jgi:hypothetical protein
MSRALIPKRRVETFARDYQRLSMSRANIPKRRVEKFARDVNVTGFDSKATS